MTTPHERHHGSAETDDSQTTNTNTNLLRKKSNHALLLGENTSPTIKLDEFPKLAVRSFGTGIKHGIIFSPIILGIATALGWL